MLTLPLYQALKIRSSDDACDYFLSTIHESIRFWDYFVNWRKVFANTSKFSAQIAIWNTLLGSDDFETDLRNAIELNPEIVQSIPSLIVRDGQSSSIFQIADDRLDPLVSVREYDFSIPATTAELIDSAVHFINMSGLGQLFTEKGITNLGDYLLGVEAGVDSNGRKNRGGTAMEAAVKQHISELCLKHGFQFMEQATEKKIQAEWGIATRTGLSERRFDFAIWTKQKLVLIEVNFYSGGGSKLKATAGEYIELNQKLNELGQTFVWITDGAGWRPTHLPLRNAFDQVDFIFNLELLAHGALEDVLRA
jgi:type II restriction enzyme